MTPITTPAHDRLSGEDEAVIAAYVLDALPAEEAQSFAAHLSYCPSCPPALDQFADAAGKLGLAVGATEVSADLRARTMAAIAETTQVSRFSEPGPTPLAPSPAPVDAAVLAFPRQRRSLTRVFAVAAAALLAVSVGLGAAFVRQQNELDDARAQAVQVSDVLRDAGGRVAAAPIASGGTGAVVIGQNRAVVLLDGLASLPADRTYQLWISDGRVIRSGGVLTVADGRGSAVVGEVPTGGALLLSVEPDGGSRQPTTTPLWTVPA